MAFCPVSAFMRTRHPTPALVLTASMTLRLQPSHLGRLAPSLVPSSSTSASESLYLHDLLSSLSEGPSYPDESSAERAARTHASLAKLPLGKLPSSILGSKLVTPARNAKEVGQIILSKTKQNATDNGDMGDKKDAARLGSSRGGRRVLTNEGLMAYQLDLDGKVSTLSADEQVRGLGEEVVVLQRSTRKVLDVQSAILVRMRTITVPGIQDEDEDVSSGTALQPTLLLCVEVENAMNSGMKFAMDKVEVLVSTPASSKKAFSPPDDQSIHVAMHRMGDRAEPLLLEQGDQQNLLYRMVFSSPAYSKDGNDEAAVRSLNDASRIVTIKLLGRPVLMRREDGVVESYTPTKNFTSTWTCTLDLSAQMRMVALQRVMYNGAGGERFGGRVSASMLRKNGSSLTIAPTTASTMFTGTVPLPASPTSMLPRTPLEIQNDPSSSARQFSPSQMMSMRLPSMRIASASSQNEVFVPLRRSTLEHARNISSPAFPGVSSALANQSILARARMNRSSTTTTGRGSNNETRQLFNGKGEIEAKSRNASDNTVTSMQRQGSYYKNPQKPREAMELDDDPTGREHLLPLNDKRSSAVIQRLLYNPAQEQGLLIDVVARLPSEDSSSTAGGQRHAAIEVQVENRSGQTRTIVFGWRIPPAHRSASSWNSVTLDEDDVQVGPLQRGDSEVVTLTLSFAKPGVHQLPPLAVYDILSGVERVLQGMQSIVI
jgi:hypothetical protein